MAQILLVQTGEAPAVIRKRLGGYADWFRTAMRLPAHAMRAVRVHEGETLPAPDDVAGAVVTGSAAIVTEREPWSEATGQWLRTAVDKGLSLFGVCYGHQLMADALGGELGWLQPREIGTREVIMNRADAGAASPWMAGLPAQFDGQVTYRQAVTKAPPGAEVLAHTARDPHHILRYAPQVVSSQLHPEFTPAIMRAHLALRPDTLRGEGLDPQALADGVGDAEAARALLEQFAQAALAGASGPIR